ncbi:hypothetical protein QP185_13270 [Sphingomonas aerolata]
MLHAPPLRARQARLEGADKMEKDVVQADAVLVEPPQRHALLGQALQHVGRIDPLGQRHVIVAPALRIGRAGLRALDAGTPHRRIARDDRRAGRQPPARLRLRALEHLAPLREQQQPVAQPLGMLHHMRREHHGRPAPRCLQDLVFQQPLVHRVETRKGFVEQQQLRAVDQRRGELDLLRHALGQLVDLHLGRCRKAEPVEQRMALARALRPPTCSSAARNR